MPTTPGPARLGPDCSGADLKVPLSSRSSGGAAARCLLWDIARRDGLAAGGRAVRSDVLAPRVSRSPRGGLQRCRRRLLRLLVPSRLASLLRRGRAKAEPRCSSAGHAPSLPGLRVLLQGGPRPPARGSPGRPAPPLLFQTPPLC